ncbi:MAG: cob(I)yrinic acid a,c-diamide adenosyltransferase [Gemmatimonadaceae bacterium]|nr:cob(I)yrinic acid a,c-diamide adenosyltransferase [Gemmatimonadaceae bacterium]MBX9856780.1 cob(I)yrinic acid a,c-diamide adenosyltransferase [Gemmatimonadaceae bacterium]
MTERRAHTHGTGTGVPDSSAQDHSGQDAPRTDPLQQPTVTRLANGRQVPIPRQKRPGPYRVPPRAQRHGLLIVNTGDGKGKTTAALGVLLRAYGRGMEVGMYQFVKRLTNTGEHRVARRLGVVMEALGAGCTGARSVTDTDIARARAGWQRVQGVLAEGRYDVLILDELTLPMTWGWLDEQDVIEALRGRAQGTHVIVTGRHAPEALVAAADLVTDMRVIKHPYRSEGLKAQGGIDV